MIFRWTCEKCNKKWMYPVEKCIYCRGALQKQKSTTAKIIGLTKVLIPSPMHPKIPYTVLLLEDKYGNRMPKKTMKKYNIGDEYTFTKATGTDAVAILKVKYDIFEAVCQCFELLVLGIAAGDKVIIKPSIIEPAYPYQSVCTSPKVLDAVITYLNKMEVTDIIVAEQAFAGYDTHDAAKKAGILEVCKKHNVEFADIKTSEFIVRETSGISLKIARPFLERKIINVPVYKTHAHLGIAAAMENMLRIVDADTQQRMYAGDIQKTLPLLIKELPPVLTIVDATIGMQGQGPTPHGDPAFLNLLLAGHNPVTLDSVCAAVGEFPVPVYVREAAELLHIPPDIGNIEIVGDELAAVQFPLRPSQPQAHIHPYVELIDGKAAPDIFSKAHQICARLHGVSGALVSLVIGAHFTKADLDGKKRIVAFGDDAIAKAREFGIPLSLELSADGDLTEHAIHLKALLENPEKSHLSPVDKVRSKMAMFGIKLQKKFS